MASEADLAVEDAGARTPESLLDADLLTPYAVRLRYGGADPGTVDRATALGFATAAVRWGSEHVDASGEPPASTRR